MTAGISDGVLVLFIFIAIALVVALFYVSVKFCACCGGDARYSANRALSDRQRLFGGGGGGGDHASPPSSVEFGPIAPARARQVAKRQNEPDGALRVVCMNGPTLCFPRPHPGCIHNLRFSALNAAILQEMSMAL
jgi:hypothetical protein